MSDTDDFLPQLRATFQVEASEHLQTLAEGLAQLAQRSAARNGAATNAGSKVGPGANSEAGGPDPAARESAAVVERIFRAAHSLKGAARAVGFAHVEALCEAMEDVLAAWRAGAPPDGAALGAMQRAADAMGGLLAGLPVPAGPELASAQAARRMLAQLMRTGIRHAAAASPQPTAAPASSSPSSSPSSSHLSPPSSQTPTTASAAVASTIPPSALPTPTAATDALQAAAAHASPPAAPPRRTSVRVTTAALEAQLLQAEELLAAKAAARQRAAELASLAEAVRQMRRRWADAPLDARLQQQGAMTDALRELQEQADAAVAAAGADGHAVGKLVDDMLDHAKTLLLLPFSTLSVTFPRLVRDLCGELGKEAELRIQGEEVKLEKHVLEEIKDPLIHLLRNAVDHGLEPPARRIAAGKPRAGVLELSVRRVDGNKVLVTLADDGGGVDIAAIAAAALRHGLVTSAELSGMDEAQQRALVFRSAVTSSRAVTRVSGRGLGLAIVREKVEALGGEVTVDSAPGAGTRFRMLLPVTRATFRGILVEAAGQTLVVPTAQVERVGRALPGQIHPVEGRDTLALDGRVIPLGHLADVLDLPPRRGVTSRGAASLTYIVIGGGERRMALTVDAVADEREVLVKPLRKPLVRVRNVAGATILASGAIAPVLNVQDLLHSAARRPGTRSSGPDDKGPEPARPRILVAEDSITSRMLLQAILESAGYRVTTAVDGADAWARLQAARFDLLVSDIEMPQLDGIGLTERVRADAALSALPVVLVTTLASPADRARGAEAGANAYIVKGGFDQGDLLGAVRQLLGN